MRAEGHYIEGAWRESAGDRIDVLDPWSGALIATIPAGDESDVGDAVAAAGRAMRDPLPAHERAGMCDRIAAAIRDDLEGFAREICAEAAKPIATARIEAQRAVSTFTFAAVEARTLAGDVVPMDAAAAGEGKIGFTIREPLGVVAAITPFNFPLNLVAHKVAPALAAGCATVLKPAEKTPLSAVRLVRVMEEAGVPAGWINLVHGEGTETVPPLVTHPDVAVVSFTGSTRVGRMIEERAAGKRVLLELGSSTPVLVEPDADLARVAAKVRAGGFTHAGQSCVSVQRIYVHRDVYADACEAIAAGARTLKVGDPADDATEVGPLIRPSERDRVLSWIKEAEAAGARILAGGTTDGPLLAPTVIADADPQMRVVCEEVFGPVVAIMPYDDLDAAIDAVNASPFGLNAAVFTAAIDAALRVARRLHAGQVLVNESPTWRTDQMPYGGVGASGNTLEGPRYAVAEMTREKLVTIEP